jgi:hypothetical protein
MKSLVRVGADATAGEVAETVRWDGARIVENPVDPSQLAAAFDELKPYIEDMPTSNTPFLGLRTKRIGGLMGRPATALPAPQDLATGGDAGDGMGDPFAHSAPKCAEAES